MSQKTNEQVVLDEITRRVKQFLREEKKEKDEPLEEYYHRFLHQHAGCISGMAEVLKINEHDWDWRAYSEQLIIYEVYRNKYKLLFHINQIMKIVLFLFISAGVAAVIISAISAAIRHIKLM